MNEPSENLEREAERVRAQLSDTADELRARVSPGQIMDDMMTAIRDGGATEMLDNLAAQARANPVAVAMIGGGLAWLMLGRGTSDGNAVMLRDYDGGMFHDSRRDYGDRDRFFERSDTGGSVVERVKQAAGSTQEAVGGALRGAATAVEHQIHDAADGLRHGARDAMRGMRDGSHRARGAMNSAMDREPLLIGAVGFAAGALVGAILPTSEIERRNLGPAGEVLQEKAGALLDEGVAMARDVASNRNEPAVEARKPEVESV
ncbi:MAG: DUF3618 domain-containing protein [Mangrovicoccus sp.]|nr:DUF3618 domain-containing protein [Mangrovicoccus sp.]